MDGKSRRTRNAGASPQKSAIRRRATVKMKKRKGSVMRRIFR